MAKRQSRTTTKKTQPALPSKISPMLAQIGEPFDSKDHLFEVKWDGTRCLAFIEADRLQLQNRRFLEMRDRYPELACLSGLPPGTIIDGEIVVLENGKPSFPKLQQREHLIEPRKIEMLVKRLPATLMAFDLLYLKGKEITAQPLIERREQLRNLITKLANLHVMVPDHVLEHGKRLFAEIERHELEGIMAKRLDSPYLVGKRSPHWLKIKASKTDEFEIIGYEQREGQRVVSALVIGMPHGRSWHYKGKVGSGFTEAQRCEFFEQFVKMPPLERPPKNAPAETVWRKTGLKCQVRFFEKTKTGMLRAPVFKGFVGNR